MLDNELRTKNFRLSIVIPTYNEAENIERLLRRISHLALPFDANVIIVDDNSRDGTIERINRYMVAYPKQMIQVIHRPMPLGIGSAYLRGFKFAIEQCNADYVAEIDADLQHPPETLTQMCQMIDDNKCDVVIASRYIENGGSFGWSPIRKLVSKIANLLSSNFIRAPVSDSTSGFRILSSRAIKSLLKYEMTSAGYAFQVESLYIYKKHRMSFAEIPFIFECRRAGRTKLHLREMLAFLIMLGKVGLLGRVQLKNSSKTPSISDSNL